MLERVEQRILNWSGHMKGMDDGIFTQKVYKKRWRMEPDRLKESKNLLNREFLVFRRVESELGIGEWKVIV